MTSEPAVETEVTMTEEEIAGAIQSRSVSTSISGLFTSGLAKAKEHATTGMAKIQETAGVAVATAKALDTQYGVTEKAKSAAVTAHGTAKTAAVAAHGTVKQAAVTAHGTAKTGLSAASAKAQEIDNSYNISSSVKKAAVAAHGTAKTAATSAATKAQELDTQYGVSATVKKSATELNDKHGITDKVGKVAGAFKNIVFGQDIYVEAPVILEAVTQDATRTMLCEETTVHVKWCETRTNATIFFKDESTDPVTILAELQDTVEFECIVEGSTAKLDLGDSHYAATFVDHRSAVSFSNCVHKQQELLQG